MCRPRLSPGTLDQNKARPHHQHWPPAAGVWIEKCDNGAKTVCSGAFITRIFYHPSRPLGHCGRQYWFGEQLGDLVAECRVLRWKTKNKKCDLPYIAQGCWTPMLRHAREAPLQRGAGLHPTITMHHHNSDLSWGWDGDGRPQEPTKVKTPALDWYKLSFISFLHKLITNFVSQMYIKSTNDLEHLNKIKIHLKT